MSRIAQFFKMIAIIYMILVILAALQEAVELVRFSTELWAYEFSRILRVNGVRVKDWVYNIFAREKERTRRSDPDGYQADVDSEEEPPNDRQNVGFWDRVTRKFYWYDTVDSPRSE